MPPFEAGPPINAPLSANLKFEMETKKVQYDNGCVILQWFTEKFESTVSYAVRTRSDGVLFFRGMINHGPETCGSKKKNNTT